MKTKLLLPIFVLSLLVFANKAEAALTVDSGSIAGSGNITLQPASGGSVMVSGKMDVSGHVAIGADATVDSETLNMWCDSCSYKITQMNQESYTDLSGDYIIGIGNFTELNPAVSPTAWAYGILSDIGTKGGNANPVGLVSNSISTTIRNTGTSPTAYGLEMSVSKYGTGTLTDASAARVRIWVAGSGVITNGYGIHVVNPSVAGTITNNFGTLIGAQTAGTNNAGLVIGEATGTKQTNILVGTTTQPSGSYSIYNSSTDQNYFAGNVGIGTVTPGASLDVQGGVNLEKGASSVSTNAVTISATSGIITDSTDINLDTTRTAITLTNTRIATTSVVVASVCSALDAGAALQVWTVPGSGSASVLVRNSGTANQTSDYKICFVVTN